MPELTFDAPPRPMARAAGAFWLLTFLAGLFAMISFQSVVVGGNAAATAANIVSREAFYRAGIAANVIATIAYLVATILVYYLLAPANRRVSLLAAFFSLIGCALSALSFVFQLGPLVVLRGTTYIEAFGIEERQALGRLLLQMGERASNVGFVFFGLHCLLIGWLILQSRFMHRAVGALMAFGGCGWLIYGLTNLLSPSIAGAVAPFILFPGMIGEASLIGWLLVRGVDAERWGHD
jgi:hypothetical protein